MLKTIEIFAGEFWQTLRRLGRERGFVVAFVVTLALGIGANGAIFTALNAYLLQPLPYPQAGQLSNVYLGSHVLHFPKGYTSAYLAKNLGKAKGVASWGLYKGGKHGVKATVISNGRPRSVAAVPVTASLFKTLGVQPLLGRWIKPSSNTLDGPREVVLSYGFWQSAFGGQAHAVGKTLKINGHQYTVVGVMPKRFGFPNRSTKLWSSARLSSAVWSASHFGQVNWSMVVRRKPGVSQAALLPEYKVQLARAAPGIAAHPDKYKFYIGAMSLRQWFGGSTGSRLLLLQLGALLLLVLAAANLGNLALVRTLRRRHELGLRITLGASRLALLRLVLFETVPLGIAAAIGAGFFRAQARRRWRISGSPLREVPLRWARVAAWPGWAWCCR